MLTKTYFSGTALLSLSSIHLLMELHPHHLLMALSHKLMTSRLYLRHPLMVRHLLMVHHLLKVLPSTCQLHLQHQLLRQLTVLHLHLPLATSPHM
jgi:hypothetical protein